MEPNQNALKREVGSRRSNIYFFVFHPFHTLSKSFFRAQKTILTCLGIIRTCLYSFFTVRIFRGGDLLQRDSLAVRIFLLGKKLVDDFEFFRGGGRS